jgi:DNA-binding transcriptional LysR family regulator
MLGDYLYEFSVIVREGSISRAAEKLGLSQSALSRHLASLEKSLNASLVSRGAEGVQVTEDGRFAFEVATQIARKGDALKARLRSRSVQQQLTDARKIVVWPQCDSSEALKALAGEASASARFGETEGGGDGTSRLKDRLDFLEPAFPSQIGMILVRRQADIVLAYRYAVEDQAASLLLEVGADGTLSSPSPSAQRAHIASVLRSPCVAVVEKNHPLSSRGWISIDDLREYKFVRSIDANDSANAAWGELARICSRRGIALSCRTVSVDSTSSLLSACPGGVEVLDAASFCVEKARATGHVVIPVSDIELEILAVVRVDDAEAIAVVEGAEGR